MLKLFVTSFFMLIITGTALAKSRDVYPVPCDQLWTAVKTSLDNPRDYGILWMNDEKQKAAFVIVGELTRYTDKIELNASDGGCAVKEIFLQDGPDDSDARQFHHRLARSLAKLQAAKTRTTISPMGQQ